MTDAPSPRCSSGSAEALRLLNKIVDLIDNEDANDPLDDAINYAQKAIVALGVAQGSPEPVGWFQYNDYHGWQQVAKEYEGGSGQTALYALSSTDRETVSPASYCALCDLEHPLHEDAQGFHHVIKGERVACPVTSTHEKSHG